MNKQALLVALSFFPFVVSSSFAYIWWEVTIGLSDTVRLVIVTISWVAAFAAGTRAFWKVVERLVPRTAQ